MRSAVNSPTIAAGTAVTATLVKDSADYAAPPSREFVLTRRTRVPQIFSLCVDVMERPILTHVGLLGLESMSSIPADAKIVSLFARHVHSLMATSVVRKSTARFLTVTAAKELHHSKEFAPPLPIGVLMTTTPCAGVMERPTEMPAKPRVPAPIS